jgi:Na+/proline symporter
MKAVIWTDAVQLVVVYLGLGWMLISLMSRVDGGLTGMWQVAVEQGKDFSFVNDPEYWSFKLFTRTAFWPLLIGFFFNALYQKGADQLTVQRYLTTRSPCDAAKAMWTDILGAIPVTLILTLVGMGLFAFYTQNPDRVASDSEGYNWVVPHFIVSELPHGLAGLFLAAIVAAILTTVDSGINSLATVSMTDFQVRLGKRTMTNVEGVRWARIWTVIWGVITTGLGIFVYSTAAENILRVSIQILGLFSGALLSVFLLGILTRRANSAGIYAGVALGGGFTIWSNFFWTNSAGENICFAWPIVFGVVITFVVGYGVSLRAPANAKA